MAAKTWKCRKCSMANPSRKQLCVECGKRKRPKRPVAHRKPLEAPYEAWAERFGGYCNICGKVPTEGQQRLHRDHEHKGDGLARGLLCFNCNAKVGRLTLQEARQIVAYLERAEGFRDL